MNTFHAYVSRTIANEIPTYILRYEDLCTNPADSLLELFEFLLEVPSLKGSVCEARIKAVVDRGAHAQAIYKLKSTQSKFNKHAHMFNEAQLGRVVDTLRDLNHFFGYTEHPTLENPTAFFKYDYKSEANQTALKDFNGYQRANKEHMAAMCLRAEDRAKGNFQQQVPNFVFQPTLFGPHNMLMFNTQSPLLCAPNLTYND